MLTKRNLHINFWNKVFVVFSLLLLFSLIGYSQKMTIEGYIYDEQERTLPGVNVTLNNGEYGTVSDSKGFFKFEGVPMKSYTLRASFIGHETFIKQIEPVVQELSISLKMPYMYHQIEEVEIRSNRREQLRRAESISVDLIRDDFIMENRGGSLMQTLSRVPGIRSMDIGSGVSKPVIRGLGYYRVAFAQNGIKQSGQHWSSHTGLSINQENISQLEIIKGPASFRYGSDAIGGVINVLPPSIPEEGVVSGEVRLSGRTNANWLGGSASVSTRRKDVYMHANITHNNFGDFKVPKTDVFLLPAPVSAAEASHEVELGEYVPNTAGRENAFSLLTGIVKPWGNSYIDINYHSTKTGFFDYIGLQHEAAREKHQESNRDIRIPYQIVDNFSISHFTNRFIGVNKIELAVGYQYNISSEHSPLFDRTGNRQKDVAYFNSRDNLELWLGLHSVTANALYSLRSIDNHIFDFIINTQYEKNNINGYSHILPEYSKKSAGTGIIHRYDLSSNWIINSGLRIDLHNYDMIKSVNPDPAFGELVFNPDYNENFVGTSFSFGVNYLPNSGSVIKANVGKSYRLPSAYELGAYGLHRHEGRFERGDLNIKPEEAIQLDLAYEFSHNKFDFSVSPFVNYFTNYLFLNPTPELRPEGQVYEYEQTVALLYGGEVSIEYTHNNKLNVLLAGEYVYAVNLDLMSALPFTPPLSAISEINYLFNDTEIFYNNKAGIAAVVTAAQNYTVPNELSTPGYYLVNLNFSSSVKLKNQEINLSLRVRNLFDTKHFNHLSFYRRMRIPEPGRDIQLFVTIPF